MSRVDADLKVCQGYGNCADEAPEMFDVDDDGLVVVLQPSFDEPQRDRVEAAVRSCPVSALVVVNE